ncbi:MAG: ABC transporter ATP-binding protein [Spirochaetes bacterium]|nr:ABC transporter ATP-binding protein [Spirochaetota bacterium]
MHLQCDTLSAGYGREMIINEISLTVKKGDITAIIGPNGSGKSTLLRAISGNIKNTDGKIFLNGKPVSEIRPKALARELTYMPQVLAAYPGFLVKDIVACGRFPHLGFGGRMKKEDHEKVNWAIESVGLQDYKDRTISSLSGGEFQMTRIAMAIAQETDLVILDEPTTFLDINHQLRVLGLIRKLNESMGKTILMVLHDINHASRFSHEIVVLDKGCKYTSGTPQEILTENILQNVFKINARIFTDPDHGIYCLSDSVT